MNSEIAFVLYALNNIFLGAIAFSTFGVELTTIGKIIIAILSTIAIFGGPIVLDKINKCHCQS
jgi:hypothetical protein